MQQWVQSAPSWRNTPKVQSLVSNATLIIPLLVSPSTSGKQLPHSYAFAGTLGDT
jgi:hypothetical protein